MTVIDLAAHRQHIPSPKVDNPQANLASAALMAFARSGALGPRVDADPWAERHRPAAPTRLSVVNSAKA